MFFNQLGPNIIVRTVKEALPSESEILRHFGGEFKKFSIVKFRT